MPQITLPDGSQRSFPGPVTVAEVAASIGAGLAKAALAGQVNGELVDTSHTITGDAQLAIVTAKDAQGLEMIRHSTAHLLAYAVKELFPEAQVTIGPVIEHGFYYDFSYARPFTPEDLQKIEKRMTELAEADIPVERRVMPRDEAVAFETQWRNTRPQDTAFASAAADVLLSRGELEPALSRYEVLLKRNPDALPVINNVAWLRSKLGKPASCSGRRASNSTWRSLPCSSAPSGRSTSPWMKWIGCGYLSTRTGA